MSIQKSQLKRVIDEIDRLFSDTSVPAETTEESLIEIREEIENKLECLKSDRKRKRE